MYVITGATGHTGKPLTHALLDSKKKVRIIVRDEEKAKELTDKGAILLKGDTSDLNFLNKAFEGATAVYAIIPLNFSASDYTEHQIKHADAIAKAIENQSVKYVVILSSIGAHMEKNSGVILGLHYFEEKLKKIEGLNLLCLRPTYFMENLLNNAGMVKNMNMFGSPLRGDLAMPLIATKDISAYASKRLLALDFSGHNTQYLLGARDYTMNEAAKILGNSVGKPDLNYVQFPYEAAKKAMMEMGASESVAEMMNEFQQAVNEGHITSSFSRDEESTTLTTLEEFSAVFKQVYNQI